MHGRAFTNLDHKKRYLQVAFNSTLDEARRIIAELPVSDRILAEAGTPLIKQYGIGVVRDLHFALNARFAGSGIKPYVVADLKTMDRGETEVAMAAAAGAEAVIALGAAPPETLDSFITACDAHGVAAMIDMMNVEYPLATLRKLKRPPPVVILHRGVDEERLNKEKQIPLHEIRRIKGAYDIMISIAGGDTAREVQRAIFNDADIAVVWKSVYQRTGETVGLIETFLKDIK